MEVQRLPEAPPASDLSPVPQRASGLSPVSLAVQDGTVWAADPGADRVVGVDQRSLGVVAEVPLEGLPTVVAAGGSGVWVAERLANRVVRLGPGPGRESGPGATGAVAERTWFTGGDFPEAMAADATGVWVVNFAGRSLVRIDADAAGGSGVDAGPVLTVPLPYRPTGVAATEDTLWITDTAGDAVEWRGVDGEVRGRTVVAGGPDRVVASAAGVWVAARLGGRLVRLDPGSGEVTGEVALGFRPSALALGAAGSGDPGDERVWVADAQGGRVVAIDPESLQQTASIAVGGGPSALVVADGQLWVAEAQDAALSVIDPTSGERRVVPLPARDPGPDPVVDPVQSGGTAAPLAAVPASVFGRTELAQERFAVGGPAFYLAAAGDDLWLTEADRETDAGSVVRVDVATGTVSGRWSLEGSGGGLAVAAGRVFAAAFDRNEVWVVDVDAVDGAAPVARIPVGIGPLDVVAALDAIWVAVRGDGQVVRIDPLTLEVVAVFNLGTGVANLTVVDDRLWVTLPDARSVAEVDPESGAVLRRVLVGNTPVGITGGAGRVWVTTRDDGVLSAIDPRSGNVTSRTIVGNRPRGVLVVPADADAQPDGAAADPPGERVLVAVGGDGAVVVVDAQDGAITGVLAAGTFPLNLVADPRPGPARVWVSDLDGGQIIGFAPSR